MQWRLGEAELHYVDHGTGTPLVALHGVGVDHREIEAAVEAVAPRNGYRRIYPDLPGMGGSTADGLTCNDDVVSLLAEFIDHLSAGPVVLLGHSYGAYLARGVAARRPEMVRGLALVCPVAEHTTHVPEHRVVRVDVDAYAAMDPAHRARFDEYFVVRTAATARRFCDHILPGTSQVDEAALGRIFAGWTIDLPLTSLAAPTLIVAGRQDSVVGYADATQLLEAFPRATLAIVDGAGHALMHERPELLAALVADWLDHVR